MDVTPRIYRAQYAQSNLPANYSGSRHLLMVLVLGGAAVAAALWAAFASLTGADLWVVPATLLVANAVEYLAHRGPMHHRLPWLGALHSRHALRHHRYFTAEHMQFESARDFHAVLFPPALLLFFGAIAVLLSGVVALFATRAASWLFFATAVSHYLIYELLHFIYHSPSHWRAARIPGVRLLARLHRLHHDPLIGRSGNYNLTLPLCDLLAGTLRTESVHMPTRSDAQNHRSPEEP